MADERNRPTTHPEYQGMPPRVDFRQLAQDAITGGIFARDEEAIRLNRENSNLPYHFPESMLDIPYPNGPMVIIRFEKDIPEAVMNKFRKNWVAANRLLLPTDQVLLYFHERFVAQDVFQARTMSTLISDYDPHHLIKITGYESDYPDDSLSFTIDGERRRVTDRKLFTYAEEEAGVELVAHHPELVLTILGYQAVIQDFIQELGHEFMMLSVNPRNGVTQEDMQKFKNFFEQWDSINFTNQLVPAIALFYTRAKQENPALSDEAIFTQQLFQEAADFIIDNGAFRNFVTVPAKVASDGKERVNHFLCPAVGTIREQLLDGSLLYRVFTLTTQLLKAGDPTLIDEAAYIQGKAKDIVELRQRLEERARQRAIEDALPTVEIATEQKTLQEILAEAITKALQKNKPATFTFEGTPYIVSNRDLEEALDLHQQRQRGDIVINPRAGSSLDDALQTAIRQSLSTGLPVFFNFNDVNYRITPEKVAELLANSVV